MPASEGHDQVVLGAFASPHGVRGLIKVKAFTGDPLAITAYGPVKIDDGRTVQLTAHGVNKGLVLTEVEGVTSREDAEALRGKTFSIDRNKLPPADQDEVYQTDLMGRIVQDPELGEIGEVRAVFNFGAGEMLEVRRKKGKSILLPFGGGHTFILEDDKIILNVDPVWLEDE
jgi:16S rRNA processing protein RimM